MSYPSEPDRFFERFLCFPVGDGTYWVSIGGDSRLILEVLGRAAALYDVVCLAHYPRRVVNL